MFDFLIFYLFIYFKILFKNFSNFRENCDEENLQIIEEFASDESANGYLADKLEVDMALARFFFGEGLAFMKVESNLLRDFLEIHRKFSRDWNRKYIPPSRQTLGGTILNKVHQFAVTERIKLFKESNSVVLVDGWKNKVANSKLFVCTLKNIRADQTFLSAIDVSIEAEDGENLAQQINLAITKAKETYETNVFAIVSDNASNIKSGCRLARNCDGDPLWVSTCSSHSADLMFNTLIQQDPTFFKLVKLIVKEYRKPKCEALLVRRGGQRMIPYPETRFCYLRDSMVAIWINLRILKDFCTIPDLEIDPEVQRHIRSRIFKNKLKEFIDQFTPICKLINRWQSPNCNVADSTENWLELLENADQEMRKIILDRIVKAIFPVGFAANILHHKYQGKRLQSLPDDTPQLQILKTIGKRFINENLSDEGKMELTDYKEKLESYKSLIDKSKDPLDYWTIMSLKYPQLSEFTLKLMIIPASTALIEGFFSQWTYVHNKYRNSLKFITSCDAIDVYHSLHSGKYRRTRKKRFSRFSLETNIDDYNMDEDDSDDDDVTEDDYIMPEDEGANLLDIDNDHYQDEVSEISDGDE